MCLSRKQHKTTKIVTRVALWDAHAVLLKDFGRAIPIYGERLRYQHIGSKQPGHDQEMKDAGIENGLIGPIGQ